MNVRYERVAETHSDSKNSSSSSFGAHSMSASQKVLSFPLESDLQEVELPSLPEGKYVVCAEAVRAADGAVLEEECFVTQVRSAFDGNDANSGELNICKL